MPKARARGAPAQALSNRADPAVVEPLELPKKSRQRRYLPRREPLLRIKHFIGPYVGFAPRKRACRRCVPSKPLPLSPLSPRFSIARNEASRASGSQDSVSSAKAKRSPGVARARGVPKSSSNIPVGTSPENEARAVGSTPSPPPSPTRDRSRAGGVHARKRVSILHEGRQSVKAPAFPQGHSPPIYARSSSPSSGAGPIYLAEGSPLRAPRPPSTGIDLRQHGPLRSLDLNIGAPSSAVYTTPKTVRQPNRPRPTLGALVRLPTLVEELANVQREQDDADEGWEDSPDPMEQEHDPSDAVEEDLDGQQARSFPLRQARRAIRLPSLTASPSPGPGPSSQAASSSLRPPNAYPNDGGSRAHPHTFEGNILSPSSAVFTIPNANRQPTCLRGSLGAPLSPTREVRQMSKEDIEGDGWEDDEDDGDVSGREWDRHDPDMNKRDEYKQVEQSGLDDGMGRAGPNKSNAGNNEEGFLLAQHPDVSVENMNGSPPFVDITPEDSTRSLDGSPSQIALAPAVTPPYSNAVQFSRASRSSHSYGSGGPLSPPFGPFGSAGEDERMAARRAEKKPVVHYLSFKGDDVPVEEFMRNQRFFQATPGETLIGDDARYLVIAFLGSGASGAVLKCLDMHHPTFQEKEEPRPEHFVAIKMIKIESAEDVRAEFEYTVSLILQKDDDGTESGCVQVKDTLTYQGFRGIVMEVMACSLLDIMKDKSFIPFPADHVLAFARQLIRTWSYFVENEIVHTDFKPGNILLRNFSFDLDHQTGRKTLIDTTISTCDFGLAVLFDPAEQLRIEGKMGTFNFNGPEVALKLRCTPAFDIWSIAAVVASLHLGFVLFPAPDYWTPLDQLHMFLMVLECDLPASVINSISDKHVNEIFDDDGNLKWPTEQTTSECEADMRTIQTLDERIPPSGPTRLLNSWLRFVFQIDPVYRPTPEEARNHPYLAQVHCPTISCPNKVPPLATQVNASEALCKTGEWEEDSNGECRLGAKAHTSMKYDHEHVGQPTPALSGKHSKKEKKSRRASILQNHVPDQQLLEDEIADWIKQISQAVAEALKKGTGAAANRLELIVDRLKKAGTEIHMDQIDPKGETQTLRKAVTDLSNSKSDFHKDAKEILHNWERRWPGLFRRE